MLVDAQVMSCQNEIFPGSWVSTKITLKQGDKALITSTGTMRYKDPPNISFQAGGDAYGVWSVKAKVGETQIVDVGGAGEIIAAQDGTLELGVPARANTPVADSAKYLDPNMSFCATVKVVAKVVISNIRIQTTRSCVPEDNENVKSLGQVKVTIGGKTVTTDANGTAVVQLPAGEYTVSAQWSDAVVGYVYQAGTIFRPFDMGPKINPRNQNETIEVRMMTCDKTGQPKARARIAGIGRGSSMRVRIAKLDTGQKIEQDATVGLVLRDGDILDVRGSGKLDWLEGGTIAIERDTTLVIGATRPGNVEGVSIRRGLLNFWFNPATDNKTHKFEAGTNTVCLSPQGTKFSVGYDENKAITSLKVDEGEVEIIPRDPAVKGLTLRAGQQVDVTMAKIGQVSSTSGKNIATANQNFGPLHEGEDIFDAGDYRSFNIAEPRIELCLEECARDARCKAVTYTKPGTYGNPQAACWLKERAGRLGPHANATSAVKIQSSTDSNVTGKWMGSWRNTKSETGTSTINITEGPGGVIRGDEDGWQIENGKRAGDTLTWEYKNQNNGCRNYKIEMKISADGKTMNGTYYVVDSCTKLTYTGTYENFRKL